MSILDPEDKKPEPQKIVVTVGGMLVFLIIMLAILFSIENGFNEIERAIRDLKQPVAAAEESGK